MITGLEISDVHVDYTINMAAVTLSRLSVFTFTVLLGYIQTSGAVQCYTCSYIFSGNTGIYNYECVNDTANFVQTSTVSCDLPNKCIIKTVYTEGYGFIHSMTKGCQVPERDTGCVEDGTVRPTCFYNCETDLCNGVNGDIKPDTPPSGASQMTISSREIILLSFFLLAFLTR